MNRGLIVKDGRVLLLRRHMSLRNNPGMWEFPGGKNDPREDDTVGLLRELWQETGLFVLIDFTAPLHVEERVIPDGELAGTLHVTQFWSVIPLTKDVSLSDEHVTFVWCELDQVDTFDLAPVIRKAMHASDLLSVSV